MNLYIILVRHLLNFLFLPESSVHPVVDDWVDACVGHGQPVESQVDVGDVGYLDNARVVVGVDEVDVVGRPANHEDGHHHREHLH